MSIHAANNDGSTYSSYSWTIQDKKTIDAILNANIGECFCSELFSLHDLKWKLKIYPNGMNSEYKGKVNVFLRLACLPSSWKELIISQRINCEQTCTTRTDVLTICEEDLSWGWPLDSISLHELTEAFSHGSIVFTASVNILRIILKKNNEILYQNPFNYEKNQITIIDWHLNSDQINELKNKNMGIFYESDIFDNMWCLSANMCVDNDEYVSLFLRAIGFPKNISKLSVAFSLNCSALNRTTTDEHTFDMDQQNWGRLKFVKLSELHNMNSIHFSSQIEILNEIDLYGNDLINAKFQNKNNDCGLQFEVEPGMPIEIAKLKHQMDQKESVDEDKNDMIALKKEIMNLKSKNEEITKKLNVFHGKSDIINTWSLQELDELLSQIQNGMNMVNKTKERLLENKLLCIICLHNTKNVVIGACGHFDLCNQCVQKLEAKKCPRCQQVFTGVTIVNHF